MTKSRIFLYFCLSFIGGIAVASFLSFTVFLWWGIVTLGLGLIGVFWKHKRIVVVGFYVVLVGLGIVRFQLYSVSLPHDKNFIQDISGEVIIEGVVRRDPESRQHTRQIVIEPSKQSRIKGHILIQTNSFSEFRYGDMLVLEGMLEIPSKIENFDYQEYLAKDGIFWVMSFPHIEKVAEGRGNPILQSLLLVKNKVRQAVGEHIASPQGEVILALLFGDDNLLSKDFLEKLNRVGLRHIIAISGMNITIIATIIMGVMVWIGFRRYWAFYVTLAAVFLFIAMIGFPPSAVRAGIMGALFLLASHVGRLSSASRAIVAASCLMLAVDPGLLRFDIGFQLSFAAMLGIVMFGEFFQTKISRVPNWSIFPLRQILAMTFSAQLATSPILFMNFDFFSFATPFSNILIVPLTSPLIILGIVFAFIAIMVPFAALPLAWILWLGASFIISVTAFFDSIPASSIDLYGSFLRWPLVLASIGGLWYVLRLIAKERRMQKEFIVFKIHSA